MNRYSLTRERDREKHSLLSPTTGMIFFSFILDLSICIIRIHFSSSSSAEREENAIPASQLIGRCQTNKRDDVFLVEIATIFLVLIDQVIAK